MYLSDLMCQVLSLKSLFFSPDGVWIVKRVSIFISWSLSDFPLRTRRALLVARLALRAFSLRPISDFGAIWDAKAQRPTRTRMPKSKNIQIGLISRTLLWTMRNDMIAVRDVGLLSGSMDFEWYSIRRWVNKQQTINYAPWNEFKSNANHNKIQKLMSSSSPHSFRRSQSEFLRENFWKTIIEKNACWNFIGSIGSWDVPGGRDNEDVTLRSFGIKAFVIAALTL